MAGEPESSTHHESGDTTVARWDGESAERMDIATLSQNRKQILNIFNRALILIPDLPPQLLENLDRSTSKEGPIEVFIAILGKSGSGKSTLYNSVLKSRGVLPQGSSGLACTAAPIEIRGARKNVLYEFNVIYIDAEEFRSVVVAAQKAMNGPDDHREHSMSHVSMLQAVFPDVPKDDLKVLPPDDLLNRIEILGSSEAFETDDFGKAQAWLRKRIVATKQSKQPTLAKWPLVKVAKVYIKSKFFQNNYNIVLTDVPGDGDSNKFRNARSREYIKRAAATCVVTPASRGGTDASLPAMIRESLQDIHFGGRYDKVILVSTKSDAVSTTELEQDRDDEDREKDHAKKAGLDEEIASLQISIARTQKKLKDAQAWENAYRRDHNRWKTVDRALMSGRPAKCPRTRKGHSNSFEKPPVSQNLKHKTVKNKVQEFKDLHKKYEARAQSLENLLCTDKQHLTDLVEERKEFIQALSEELISGRNTTLKDRQLEVYLEQIKNMDLEIREMAENNPDSETRPNIPERDYDEIAKHLPIFCTTARSYQNIQGYTPDEPQHKICKDVNDTGIPEFRKYLLKVGKETQESEMRTTHSDDLEILNDLSLVVKTGLKPQTIDPEKARHVDLTVKSSLTGFDTKLSTISKNLDDKVMECYQTQFASNIGKIRESAKDQAKLDMKGYTKSPKDGNGGYYSGEYKAAVKRDGVWRGVRVSLNLNQDFRMVILKCAQVYTDAVFTNSTGGIKSIIDAYIIQCSQLCRMFHDQNRSQMMLTGVSYHALRKLDDLLKLRIKKLNETAGRYKSRVSEVHSNTSLELVEEIQEALTDTYSEAFEATPTDGLSKLEAMHKIVVDRVTKTKILARPLRAWEKRMNDYIEIENKKMRKFLNKFVADWTTSYEQALLSRSAKIDLSDNPGKDDIRNMIIATQLVDDKALGLAEETSDLEDADETDKPMKTVEVKDEEMDDDLRLVDSDTEMADSSNEQEDPEQEQTDESGRDSDSD